jgi:hypothetical protein
MLSRARDSSATLRDSIVRSVQRCGVTDAEERRRNMSQPALAAPSVDELRSKVDGEVITPENPAYEEARLVWNGIQNIVPSGA